MTALIQRMLLKATLVILAVAPLVSASYKGDGTAYSKPYDMDSTGKNACGFKASKLPDRWQKYFAAMNEAQFEGGDTCGQCIRVKGRGGTVYAMVVDECPGWACKKGNVDFSTVALEEATGYSWDRKPIEWDWVDCPDGDDDDKKAKEDDEEERRQQRKEEERQKAKEEERQAEREAEREAEKQAEKEAKQEAERQAAREAEREAMREEERQQREEERQQREEERQQQALEDARRKAEREAAREARRQAQLQVEREEDEEEQMVSIQDDDQEEEEEDNVVRAASISAGLVMQEPDDLTLTDTQENSLAAEALAALGSTPAAGTVQSSSMSQEQQSNIAEEALAALASAPVMPPTIEWNVPVSASGAVTAQSMPDGTVSNASIADTSNDLSDAADLAAEAQQALDNADTMSGFLPY